MSTPTTVTTTFRPERLGPPLVTARVVAVIPNWNGWEVLEETLETLRAQSFGDLGVIVVDNGSTDGSLDNLAQRWPRVSVLANERNLGFAPAINQGVAASSGEFVALVNNDMRLAADWAANLVAALESHLRAASAASKIRMVREPGLLDGAGDIVGWDGYAARRGLGETDAGQYDQTEFVFSACAGAGMYRREAFEAVGPFDDSFFAYICDVDWGFRAQLAGYDCVYEPKALAHHIGGGTSSRVSGLELYLAHRNMISMMVKDFPAFALFRHLPAALIRRVGSFVKAIRGRQALTLLRAWFAGLRAVPRSYRARRAIQRSRVRGYRELDRMVLPRVPRRHGRAP